MKAALVLHADDALIRQQAGEINAALKGAAPGLTRVELWLIYRDNPPEYFPEIDFPLACIRLAAVEQTHMPEYYLRLLQHLIDRYPMDLFVFPSNGWGGELATRLAYRANGCSCLQVESCDTASGKLEVIKPVYGNNLSARFAMEQTPCCLSVAKQPCSPVKMTRSGLVEIEEIKWKQTQLDSGHAVLMIPDPPATGLADAELVLVVGQGAGNRETVDLLQGFAYAMGAELGASRPVVMNAWVDMNRLIGTSGLIVSPKLCIAAGVSGAGVFSVGIKNSECIVAINTDPDAPIFQIADVGIVCDLKKFLTELAEVIRTGKTPNKPGDTIESGKGNQ